MAKVLANRLRKVLPLTIFESQGAFLAGRQIIDQAHLVANKAIEGYRASKMEVVTFKIDFEKAYDQPWTGPSFDHEVC